jgi:hypothetical protein
MFEHGHRLATAGNQPNSKSSQRWLNRGQALLLKCGVRRVPLRLAENLRLVEKNRKNTTPATPLHSGRQSGLIGHSQISLQPDANGWRQHMAR